ncbi:glycosyltransferase [Agrococcus beijingensis]|uniref:glycosyltransferase n=1 Tax=Agrococcus beijingensis TaxID=3068634 RepID=UPI00274180BB|nr:glycosyltransferase [Agrococcus sp. REN33]
MAHIVVTAMPFAGHVRPMTALAAALLARGHRVDAYTGARYADAFAELGCEIIPWREAQDFDEHRLSETFPETDRPGVRGMLAMLRDVFIGTAMGQVADLRAANSRERFDVLVGDVMTVGAGIAAEMLNKPWVTVSLVPLTLPSRDLPPVGFALQPPTGWLDRVRDRVLRAAMPVASAPIERAYRSVREQLDLGPGLPFAEALYSPQLVIATGSPSLEYPRSDLPETVRFVGRLEPAQKPFATPLWVETLIDEPRPVVFVTQGTLDTDPRELLLPTLEGLADLPVRVVGTTSGRRVGHGYPSNARLADFLQYPSILPHAAVGVTNGGWGGVLAMLEQGLPLVVAGGAHDKPEIAARVAWAGAGLDLRTGHPTPARVAAAVRLLLREPAYRERAALIGDELRGLGGATRAAELVEQFTCHSGLHLLPPSALPPSQVPAPASPSTPATPPSPPTPSSAFTQEVRQLSDTTHSAT